MTKCILTRIAFLAALAAAGFFLLVWWASTSDTVSREQYEQVCGSMTKEEVLQILGEPTAAIDVLHEADLKVTLVDRTRFGGITVLAYMMEWRMNHRQRLRVGFDDNDQVMMISRFNVEESFLDTIRRWIRL